jgi:oligoendopeptidase F
MAHQYEKGALDMNKTPMRNEVPTTDTWDLSSLYVDDAAWEEDFHRFQTSVPQATTYKGTLGKSADGLLSALDWFSHISLLCERLGNYAFLKYSADSGDTANQRRLGMISQAQTEFAAQMSYFDPEIQAIDDGVLKSWMKDGRFADYRVMLGKLVRFKPHVLTENEERIMALQSEVGSVPHDTFHDLTNVDMDFGTVMTDEGEQPLTQTTYSAFMMKPDRELRRKAYKQFYQVFDEHKHTLARLYEGSVKKDIFQAKVRNYRCAREASLFPDNVPVSVYDNLVQAVHDAFPTLHRYYALRKKLLGVEKLAHYDVYVPLVKGIETHTTYDEAVRIVCDALAPLGDEYVRTIREGLTTQRWVDRYENKGKRSGAFSCGAYTGHPYILLNYKEDVLRDVFTLAHEGGHSMHSWYSVHNNPYPQYDYTIFEAEVASTFNEQLVARYLLDNAQDDSMRAYIIGKQMDDIVATLFRQTMFAEFEMLVHAQVEAGEPITVEGLRNTYRSLLEAYFGPDTAFEEESDLEGLRIPHFYSAFYVYMYATGLSASIALSEKVLNGTEEDRERYLSFLKSGGSTYPIDSLRKAGVDMSTPVPVHQATASFGRLLDRFEQLIGK